MRPGVSAVQRVGDAGLTETERYVNEHGKWPDQAATAVLNGSAHDEPLRVAVRMTTDTYDAFMRRSRIIAEASSPPSISLR